MPAAKKPLKQIGKASKRKQEVEEEEEPTVKPDSDVEIKVLDDETAAKATELVMNELNAGKMTDEKEDNSPFVALERLEVCKRFKFNLICFLAIRSHACRHS
jgi:hypothetical protein